MQYIPCRSAESLLVVCWKVSNVLLLQSPQRAKTRNTMPGFIFNGHGVRGVYSGGANSIIYILYVPVHIQYVYAPVRMLMKRYAQPEPLQ